MPENSALSRPEILRPRVVPPPGFMPGALYVAIIEKTIQSTTPGDHSPPTKVESLGFFYQEKATLPPIGSSLKIESCLQGQYWSLLPPRQTTNGTMSVYNALHHLDVLGYLRIAERVNPRSLPTLIQADDKKIQTMEQMSPEIYVFNALERLRRHGFFEANMGLWNLESFVVQMKYFRDEWRNDGLEKRWHCPRPFADFPLVFFDTPVHWWVPRDAKPKGQGAKRVIGWE